MVTYLHQNGLTCKEIAAKNIVPERTIYRTINNSRIEVQMQWKKASECLRVSSKCWRIISPPVQSYSLLAVGGWEFICSSLDFWTNIECQEGQQRSHFSPRKHQGQTEITVQELDSRRLVKMKFLWWRFCFNKTFSCTSVTHFYI